MTVREKYADIIDLPHHQSETRAHMPAEKRAGQFAPFAALNGYDALVKEKARYTEDSFIPDETHKQAINRRLQELKGKERQQPLIRTEYFVPDLKKDGGKYLVREGRLKRIDEYSGRLIFTDMLSLPFESLVSVDALPDEDE